MVWQWIHGLRQLLGAFGWVLHILYALGNWTLRPEPLESGSSLFAVWVYSSWVGCARVLRSVSPRQHFEEFPLRRRFARAVRTRKLDTSPLPSYLSVLLVFGCCLWSTSYFRDVCAAWFKQWIHVLREAFGRISLVFYGAVNSNPEAFSSPFGSNGEDLHSRCFWLQLLSALFALLTLDILSRALYMAVCGNFCCVVQHFFGALDDEEIFIIEGSCQLDRSVVWTNTLRLR